MSYQDPHAQYAPHTFVNIQPGYQQEGYNHQPPPVTIVQPVVQHWGNLPQSFVCGYCGYNGVTVTETALGPTAWIVALVLFVLGFFVCFTWCICWVPLVMPTFYEVQHKCPQCRGTVHI
jgi:hypothetical protein